MPKENLAKRELIISSKQGLNPQLINYQVKCTTKSTNSYL